MLSTFSDIALECRSVPFAVFDINRITNAIEKVRGGGLLPFSAKNFSSGGRAGGQGVLDINESSAGF